ncbi:MAG: hypothetical protein WD851_07980 [Pirellulales bacterium]
MSAYTRLFIGLLVALLASDAQATTGFLSSERGRFVIDYVTESVSGIASPLALTGDHDAGPGKLTPVAASPPASGRGSEFEESRASFVDGGTVLPGAWTEVFVGIEGAVSPQGEIFCYERGSAVLELTNTWTTAVLVEWKWEGAYSYLAYGDDPVYESSETYGTQGFAIGAFSHETETRVVEFPPGGLITDTNTADGYFELAVGEKIEVVLFAELYGFAEASLPEVAEPSSAALCGIAIMPMLLIAVARALRR